MKKFVIEREIPKVGALEGEQLRGAAAKSNQVLEQLGPDIQWVQSYVADDTITCVYLATDEQLIREHGRCGGFPVDAVLEVHAVIDPTTAELGA